MAISSFDWLSELQRQHNLIRDLKSGWDLIPHKPQPKQREFLDLKCLEALYGGQAGGGKSDCLLMDALRYVHLPGYACILFRRTYTDAMLPGALMDRCREWLVGTAAIWDGNNKRFVIPAEQGRSIVAFGYMDTKQDRYRYQSSEFQRIYFDELTQFEEIQYSYMFSRLRRAEKIKAPLAVRSASNPGGVGEKWVFDRFINEKKRSKEARFIPASLEDNRFINAKEYILSLSHMDERTIRQLLHGEWLLPTTGIMYRLGDENIITALPDGWDDMTVEYYLGVDLGTREDKPTTAFCLVATVEHDNHAYIIEEEAHAGLAPSDTAQVILAFAEKYGLMQVVVDAGGLGGGYIAEMQDRWGINAEPAKKTDKLGYRKLLIASLEQGRTKLLRQGCEGLIDECSRLMWNEKGTDNAKEQDNHRTDAMLYAWRSAMPELANPQTPTYARGSAEFYAEIERKMIEREERELTREDEDDEDFDY